MSAPTGEDIYVGYRALSRRDRRFLRLLVPALLWGMCAAAAFAVLSMRSAGSGRWDTGTTSVVEGILLADPYPSIVVRSTSTADALPASGARVLLVESGKIGPRPGIEPLVNQPVRAEGYLLHRAGAFMLELLPEDEGLRGVGGDAVSVPTPSSVHEETLHGEIVDTKCFLGAMKPGTGVTHRGCAVLCLTGGIPPGFVVRSADGGETLYLLTGPAQEPTGEELLHLIGIPVEVRGTVMERSGAMFLNCDPTTIRRL